MQAHNSPKAVKITHCSICYNPIEPNRFPYSSHICQTCSDVEDLAHWSNHSSGCNCLDCSPE